MLLPSYPVDDYHTFPTDIGSHWQCTGLATCVCVEIWQVLITLAGKKLEVTLAKEKPRDRKLRNANSPRCQSIHCPPALKSVSSKY